jgi:hypothetical protein
LLINELCIIVCSLILEKYYSCGMVLILSRSDTHEFIIQYLQTRFYLLRKETSLLDKLVCLRITYPGLYYSVLWAIHLRIKENMIIFGITILTSARALAGTHPGNASALTTSTSPHILRYAALGLGAAVIIVAGIILYRKRRRS